MFESPNDAFVSKPSRHARRRDRRRLFCRSIPGGSETSSTGSLGLHIVIGDPRASGRSGPASRKDPVSAFLLAASRWRRCPRSWRQEMRQLHVAEVMAVVETAVVPFRASLSRACGQQAGQPVSEGKFER